ncbi:MAG TPA: outer membrane beta-barrel protein [Desulfobacteraceae bacterium]|nr:outer membrane beta-barrel protein [Desulfobacteraceae bacterium]
MKIFKHWKAHVVFSLLPLIMLVLISSDATGANRITLQPVLNVSEEYDDNIFLDKENRKSDYITTASPGIILNIDSEKNGLSLDYAPTWVWYHKYSGKDTVRHRGTFNFWQGFGKHLKFNLRDSYLKSEDILETFEPGQASQLLTHTRRPYQRNDARASLDYQFGPENYFTAGYRHNFIKRDDPLFYDTVEHGPFATLSYWFTKADGVEFSYSFTRYEYEYDQGPDSTDDFDGHQAGGRYIHRFGPHTKAYINYQFTARSSKEGPDEYDYKVHNGRIGVAHDFSSKTSAVLECGYYRPEEKAEDAGSGMSYSASLTRRIEHGNITLAAERGWDEGFLDVEPRGFTRYSSASAKIDYTIWKDLDAYAGISYRKNKYFFEEEDDETYTGQCGIRLKILRWLSVGLNYTRRDRRSDYPIYEYTDNRVMITFSARHPDGFRWIF